MAEFISMDFYPADFYGDAADLTFEQQGIYLALLSIAWQRPDNAIPNDMAWLRTALSKKGEWRGKNSIFKSVVPAVLDRFFKLLDDGCWHQFRLDKEREKARRRSENARKSAVSRWEMGAGAGISTKPRPNQSETAPKPERNRAQTRAKPRPNQSETISKEASEFIHHFEQKQQVGSCDGNAHARGFTVTVTGTDTESYPLSANADIPPSPTAAGTGMHDVPMLELTPPPGNGRAAPAKAVAVRVSRADFERFWDEVPRKVGKDDAERKFSSVLKAGQVTVDELISGMRRYAVHIRSNSIEQRFVVNPATWLHQGRWKDELQSKTLAKNHPRAGSDFL